MKGSCQHRYYDANKGYLCWLNKSKCDSNVCFLREFSKNFAKKVTKNLINTDEEQKELKTIRKIIKKEYMKIINDIQFDKIRENVKTQRDIVSTKNYVEIIINERKKIESAINLGNILGYPKEKILFEDLKLEKEDCLWCMIGVSMREILFRGKAIKDGEYKKGSWIYGSLYRSAVDYDGYKAYEGDIVQDLDDGTLGIVYWDEEEAGFMIEIENVAVPAKDISYYRVIGNKWDDPELTEE